MDNALRTISYIADIGSIVVLMARRRTSQSRSEAAPGTSDTKKQYKMVCHVFESEDVSTSRFSGVMLSGWGCTLIKRESLLCEWRLNYRVVESIPLSAFSHLSDAFIKSDLKHRVELQFMHTLWDLNPQPKVIISVMLYLLSYKSFKGTEPLVLPLPV